MIFPYTVRTLASYHYLKSVQLDKALLKAFSQTPVDFFLDSGAFSVVCKQRLGESVHISFNGYAAYITTYAPVISTYANLDVVTSEKKTWCNQQWMEQLNLKPLPVFHIGESWEQLEMYIERYPYIGLGITLGGPRPSGHLQWLEQCFYRAAGRSVFHGFGITSWAALTSFPWYSVDSSSWCEGFRYGRLPLFQEDRLVHIRLHDKRLPEQYSPLFAQIGFDYLDFVDRGRTDRSKIIALSMLGYMQSEQWLRTRWGPITIPGQPERGTGLKIYLSDTQKDFAHIRCILPYLEERLKV